MNSQNARIEFYVTIDGWTLEEATRIVAAGERAGSVNGQPNTDAERAEARRILRQEAQKRRLLDK